MRAFVTSSEINFWKFSFAQLKVNLSLKSAQLAGKWKQWEKLDVDVLQIQKKPSKSWVHHWIESFFSSHLILDNIRKKKTILQLGIRLIRDQGFLKLSSTYLLPNFFLCQPTFCNESNMLCQVCIKNRKWCNFVSTSISHSASAFHWSVNAREEAIFRKDGLLTFVHALFP